jgi:hypothetical protein
LAHRTIDLDQKVKQPSKRPPTVKDFAHARSLLAEVSKELHRQAARAANLAQLVDAQLSFWDRAIDPNAQPPAPEEPAEAIHPVTCSCSPGSHD